MNKNIVSLFFFLILFSVAQKAQADRGACVKYIYSHGWWRKYKYMHLTSTEMSKKNGSSTVTTQRSTEDTTASSDPGVSTGYSSSQTQSTSSWGPCAWSIFFTMLESREKYIAQNFVPVKKQMALGGGGHLAALAYFSLCEEHSQEHFSQALQRNFEKFSSLPQDEKMIAQKIDEVILSDHYLKQNCFTDRSRYLL